MAKFISEEVRLKMQLSTQVDPEVKEAIWNANPDDLLCDISGLDLPTLVMELYNVAHPVGLGYHHADDDDQLTLDEAKVAVEQAVKPQEERNYLGEKVNVINVDYVKGVPIKLRIWGDSYKPDGSIMVWTDQYDLRQGKPGLFVSVVDRLRQSSPTEREEPDEGIAGATV